MQRTCVNGSSCARPRVPPSSTRSRSVSPLASRRKRWKASAASTTRGTQSGSGRRGKGSGGAASLSPRPEPTEEAGRQKREDEAVERRLQGRHPVLLVPDRVLPQRERITVERRRA